MVGIPFPSTATRLRGTIGRYIGPGLFFVLLVALLQAPLVLRLNSHVIGRPFDDSFEVLWQLSAVAEAVFKTHTNPFYTPHVFYPQGWYLASGAQPPWYFVLLSPLTILLGPVVTYNLTILSTFIFAGLGVYWVVVTRTKLAVAGLLAGCAYIAAPVFSLRMSGHMHMLFGMMFLPYAAGALLKFIQPRRLSSRKWIILGSLFFASTVISQWYFLFIATLPLLGVALFAPSEATWRDRLTRLFWWGIISLVLMAPFVLLTWHARREMFPNGGTFSLAATASLGFSVDYLFAPNPLHPLWRDKLSTLFPISGEQDIVSIGYAALFAAVVGLFVGPRRQTRPFIAMGTIAFLLGLGPILRWRGAPVLIAAPAWVKGALGRLLENIALPAGQIPVILPGLLLYHWLPFYSSLRVWARFSIPLMLAIAVLAGFGAAWLLKKGRAGKVLTMGLLFLILFEGLVIPYSHLTAVADNDRLVNAWLAEQPEGTSLIEYPRWIDKLAMYSQSIHGQSVVNGYMSFPPAFMVDVDDELGEWPNERALPVLRDWGADYLVVSTLPDNDRFRDEIWPTVLSLDGLCPVASFPDAYGFAGFKETHVFAIVEPGKPCPSAGEHRPD